MIKLIAGAADRDPSREVPGHDVARCPTDRLNTPKQAAAHQRPAGERQHQSNGGAPAKHPHNELAYLTTRKRIDSHHQIFAVRQGYAVGVHSHTW